MTTKNILKKMDVCHTVLHAHNVAELKSQKNAWLVVHDARPHIVIKGTIHSSLRCFRERISLTKLLKQMLHCYLGLQRRQALF
jgi:hypothetical protein